MLHPGQHRSNCQSSPTHTHTGTPHISHTHPTPAGTPHFPHAPHSHRYSTFSFLDSCNFALNIYDEGSTLSIVVDAGAHGTHVAGITSAFFEDDPAMNGIAPGGDHPSVTAARNITT